MRQRSCAWDGVRPSRLVVLALVVMLLLPWQALAQQTSAAQAAPARVFGSDAGLVSISSKPEKTADFENVMAKLKEALTSSTKPERRQQLEGWKIYRALEPGANNSVLCLYYCARRPGADYTVSTILAEAFPDEVQALYKKQYGGIRVRPEHHQPETVEERRNRAIGATGDGPTRDAPARVDQMVPQCFPRG